MSLSDDVLGLLETGVYSWLEVAKVREDALFPLLGVFHRSAKRLKPEEQGANCTVSCLWSAHGAGRKAALMTYQCPCQ